MKWLLRVGVNPEQRFSPMFQDSPLQEKTSTGKVMEFLFSPPPRTQRHDRNEKQKRNKCIRYMDIRKLHWKTPSDSVNRTVL